MQKRTDICILAMIIEKIEKTKLRNDGKLKNEPEPPQIAPKGKIVFNLPYEKAQPVCCWQKDRGETKSGQKVRNMLSIISRYPVTQYNRMCALDFAVGERTGLKRCNI